jgi:hypothetical protein
LGTAPTATLKIIFAGLLLIQKLAFRGFPDDFVRRALPVADALPKPAQFMRLEEAAGYFCVAASRRRLPLSGFWRLLKPHSNHYT